MAEITDISLSIKTSVPLKASAELAQKLGLSKDSPAEDAENMVVFKVANRKMRRYVLAVPFELVVPLMASFVKHVEFAKASLHFRREFGSGVPQGLTLGDRLAWAASTHGAKITLAILTIAWENKFVRESVLGFDLSMGYSFTLSPVMYFYCAINFLEF